MEERQHRAVPLEAGRARRGGADKWDRDAEVATLRKRIDDPFLGALKYSLVACYPAILVSMMLGDWVTPFPYTQTLAGIDYTIWSWMLSGVTIALYYFTPNLQETANDMGSSSPLALLDVTQL